MSEAWKRLMLSEVLDRRADRLGTASEPTILTCTENHGLVDQMVHLGRRAATEDVSKYKLVEPFDIVYNVYLLWLGSIGQNLTGKTGVTSPVYEVFRPNAKAHAPFLGLLLRSPEMTQRYGAIAIGTVPRRRRTPWEDFLALRVDLPPVEEQLRIVDLIGAIDDAIEAAELRATSSSRLLDEFLESAKNSQPRLLGDLASMRSGPSWKATDESSTPLPGGEPVLGITNTPSGRELDLSNYKYVSGLPASTMRVTPHSTIMIRTNGNRGRIGNVYRPSVDIEGFAVSAFQIIIQPLDPTDAAIIYWALSTPSIQRKISEAASGSTGLGNVAIGWLRQLSLPFPADEERDAFVSTCEAMLDATNAADDVSRRLRILRVELLSALMSGAHRIPETYDELMGA